MPASEHILVGLSSAPSNARIIRTAATMAQAFGGSFTALFVRTPGFDAMADTDKKRLHSNMELARNLGATIETVFGDDVSYQIAEYARLSGVSKIVVGRSAATRKHPWSKPTLTEKLTRIAPNLDIHIIPDASVDDRYRPRPLRKRLTRQQAARDLLISLGALCLATGFSFALQHWGFADAILTVYLLTVLLSATFTVARSSYLLTTLGSLGLYYGLFAQGEEALLFPAMLLSALMVGSLTGKAKAHARQSAKAAYRTNLLLETNQKLQKAATDAQILQVAQTQVEKLLGRETTVTAALSSAPANALCYPIKTQNRVFGQAMILGREKLEAFENSVLLSILGECALALEGRRNAADAEASRILAEKEALRANLLRSISHDLRTPLTAISGNAGILMAAGDALDDATRESMYADIHEDALWLTGLVENLLAVTRIEDGRMQIKMQPQLVEEIVTEALTHVSRKKAEHTLTVRHREELLMARCDARLIIQVIINLVDNAIKYSPAGSSIHMETWREGDWVQISLADNGPGIPDDHKERVFEMFYTGSNPIADSRRSLGLGLGLCRSIIAAHGGTIRVTDNIPTGAIFSFTLPAEEVSIHE